MNKLRQIIRKELTEASVDRGFLNGFAEALEDLTGRKAYPKASEEDVIRYDGKGSELDIYLKGGGAVGGRLGGELEIQVIDRRGRVRTGIAVPPDPDVAAEELARELDKINEMKLTESTLRSIIREELSQMTEAAGTQSENLHGDVPLQPEHPDTFLSQVADLLERETGRNATEIPLSDSMEPGDVILFEGRNQNVRINLDARERSQAVGVIVRGQDGRIIGPSLSAAPRPPITPKAVVVRVKSALKQAGEL